jgi:hypothetical protein
MANTPGSMPDRVVLSDGGKLRELTVQEFLQLPIHVRVRAILGRSVEFYAGSVLVERQEALKVLRSLESSGAGRAG